MQPEICYVMLVSQVSGFYFPGVRFISANTELSKGKDDHHRKIQVEAFGFFMLYL